MTREVMAPIHNWATHMEQDKPVHRVGVVVDESALVGCCEAVTEEARGGDAQEDKGEEEGQADEEEAVVMVEVARKVAVVVVVGGRITMRMSSQLQVAHRGVDVQDQQHDLGGERAEHLAVEGADQLLRVDDDGGDGDYDTDQQQHHDDAP
ncbi:hypothetical protein DFQ26_002624 [Actinomortierella ambigua]|nr:hypothetical protein DFQ26_002624 [Actinomortierella ambigua]